MPAYRLGKVAGAGHGDELQFVFGTFGARDPGPFNEADRKVAATLATYWTNFAKRGDPGDPALPVWPAVRPERLPELRRARDGIQAIDAQRPSQLDVRR